MTSKCHRRPPPPSLRPRRDRGVRGDGRPPAGSEPSSRVSLRRERAVIGKMSPPASAGLLRPFPASRLGPAGQALPGPESARCGRAGKVLLQELLHRAALCGSCFHRHFRRFLGAVEVQIIKSCILTGMGIFVIGIALRLPEN